MHVVAGLQVADMQDSFKIETSRLILRPYQESDLPEYFELLSDDKNMYFLNDILTKNIEDAKLSLTDAINLFKTKEAIRFAVAFKNSTKIIGAIGYDITGTTPLGRIGYMGWFLMPKHHGNGYIPEGVKALLNYAFENDNCIRITTGCYKDNLPTQRVMAKVGFRLEAEKIQAAYHDGKMKDRLEYAINKNEYATML